MSSQHIRGDVSLAGPTAEIAVVGPKGGGEIIFRKEIAAAAGPAAEEARKIAEYTEKFANPFVAAAEGYIDDVVPPRETRKRLCDALAMLSTKRDRNPSRKHGNLPL